MSQFETKTDEDKLHTSAATVGRTIFRFRADLT